MIGHFKKVLLYESESKEKGLPWFISKAQDYFLPVSKSISSKLILNPHDLIISLYINEQLKQSNNTKNMHFKIPEQLEYILISLFSYFTR